MRAGRLRDGLVLAALALYAMSFFWQALTSVRPDAELLPLSHLLPSRLTAVHYDAVLRQSLMPRALLNSLGIAFSSTALAVGLGALAGYALARLPVPGRGVILLGMIAATAFPQIATVSPLYLLMRALGLRDTWLALILANASFALPLVIWLLAGFIREILVPRPEESSALSIRFHSLPRQAAVDAAEFFIHDRRMSERRRGERRQGERRRGVAAAPRILSVAD